MTGIRRLFQAQTWTVFSPSTVDTLSPELRTGGLSHPTAPLSPYHGGSYAEPHKTQAQNHFTRRM